MHAGIGAHILSLRGRDRPFCTHGYSLLGALASVVRRTLIAVLASMLRRTLIGVLASMLRRTLIGVLVSVVRPTLIVVLGSVVRHTVSVASSRPLVSRDTCCNFSWKVFVLQCCGMLCCAGHAVSDQVSGHVGGANQVSRSSCRGSRGQERGGHGRGGWRGARRGAGGRGGVRRMESDDATGAPTLHTLLRPLEPLRLLDPLLCCLCVGMCALQTGRHASRTLAPAIPPPYPPHPRAHRCGARCWSASRPTRR
jgi:hypothetical protein